MADKLFTALLVHKNTGKLKTIDIKAVDLLEASVNNVLALDKYECFSLSMCTNRFR
jgi:hypothetical protein